MKRLIAATLVAAIGVSLLTGCGVSNKSHDNTQVGRRRILRIKRRIRK